MQNYPATLNVPWRLRFLGGGGKRLGAVDALFAQNAVQPRGDRMAGNFCCGLGSIC